MSAEGREAVHEGAKVRELLELAGRRPADLSRACRVSESMVAKYVKTARFGAKAWETVSRGLAMLDIDPRLVRSPPEPLPATLAARDEPEKLRPLLDKFQRRQLEALLQILDASEATRYVLRFLVKDRLDRGA
jgi:hypothetical protein